MNESALVLDPKGRVAVVHATCGPQRVLVRPVGDPSRPWAPVRYEAFDWEELVELKEARPLRRQPVARVETEWGPVQLQALALEEQRWGTMHTDKVGVSSPRADGDGPVYECEPLRINRVPYSIGGALGRDPEGGWKAVDYLRLYRHRSAEGGTPAANQVLRQELEPALVEWLEKHPHFLEEAWRVRLSNEVAQVEGEVLAAKHRYRKAVARRQELLREEKSL